MGCLLILGCMIYFSLAEKVGLKVIDSFFRFLSFFSFLTFLFVFFLLLVLSERVNSKCRIEEGGRRGREG